MERNEAIKDVVVIHTVYFRAAIGACILLPLVIFLYAFFNNALEIFKPFIFIIPIICAVGFLSPAPRNVKIDKTSKLIIIKDSFSASAEIPFGSISAVTKEGEWYVISYNEKEKLLEFRFAIGYYYPKALKRIMDYMRELNPQANISV